MKSKSSSNLKSISNSASKTISKASHGSLSSIIIILLFVLIIILIGTIIYSKMNKKEEFGVFNFLKSNNDTPLTGYWMWTWDGEGGGNPPTICDIGIRFGGESPKLAIDTHINMVSSLTSREKFLNLGGGLETGIWQLSDFAYINSNLSNIKSKGWTGLCFDIEVCPPSISFVNAFADCFAKCKAARLKVLVTMSHTVPYGCQTGSGQGMDLVNAWIKDHNIDYLSPQLYTEGHTLEPTDLSMFSNASAKIIPSIPYDSDWSKIQNLGIIPAGYLSWLRTKINYTKISYCGTSWANANSNCSTTAKCVSQDNECPSGLQCFGGITCSVGGGGSTTNFCGTSWDNANSNCSTAAKCVGQDNECPSGQKCFGGITCSVGGDGSTTNLCGTNWDKVKCSTSQRCPGGTDNECPSGQKCWGNNKC